MVIGLHTIMLQESRLSMHAPSLVRDLNSPYCCTSRVAIGEKKKREENENPSLCSQPNPISRCAMYTQSLHRSLFAFFVFSKSSVT